MIEIFISDEKWDYELLDTGGGQKLEQVGKYSFVRPFEDAIWQKTLKKEWHDVDGEFLTSQKVDKAGWQIRRGIENKWPIEYKGIEFLVQPTSFRHFGFFPEQASHWDFIEEKIKNANLGKNFGAFALGDKRTGNQHDALNSSPNSPKIKFLNLFGYTGIASLFALRAGAEVTHLDASKQSIDWAKENQKIAGLENLPMRVICDDALKFIEREIKRGNKYDCIVLDPPKFGRGPKGEVWKIEEKLPKLLLGCRKILSENPLFVILTSYAINSSSLSLGYALADAIKDLGGEIRAGELCILEKTKGRKISLANTAIWTPKQK